MSANGTRTTPQFTVNWFQIAFFLVFVWILVLLELGGATSCVVSKEMSADSKMKGVIVSAFAKVSCASLLPLGHTQALRIGAQIAQCAGA